jgi:threonine dehydrogenase-like Zn-dependent dehydrogenase
VISAFGTGICVAESTTRSSSVAGTWGVGARAACVAIEATSSIASDPERSRARTAQSYVGVARATTAQSAAESRLGRATRGAGAASAIVTPDSA